MLTREDIRKNLTQDPYWEPSEDASADEWDLFDEVYQEMDEAGLFKVTADLDEDDDHYYEDLDLEEEEDEEESDDSDWE